MRSEIIVQAVIKLLGQEQKPFKGTQNKCVRLLVMLTGLLLTADARMWKAIVLEHSFSQNGIDS